jgi:hypothetical protein
MKENLKKIHRLIFAVSSCVYFYVVITFMSKKGVFEKFGDHPEADIVLLLANVCIVFFMHKVSGAVAKTLTKDQKSNY